MNASQFAALVSAAIKDVESLKLLMAMGLGTGFMARLARKELNRIGIQVEAGNDSSPKAARIC